MIKMPLKFYADGIAKGVKLFALDSLNAGEDDVILAESEDEAKEIVTDYLEQIVMPEGWTLTEITSEEFYDWHT